MGQKQEKLKYLTLNHFEQFRHEKLSLRELENSKYIEIADRVYRNLNGQYSDIPINYGSWDISTSNFILEFDEERHFNRYRLTTLKSELYNQSKFFIKDDYSNYCHQFEGLCLRAASWGKNWEKIQ
ncbi:MAG TPA: hypothetical protein DIT07_06495 [Sphingobacteriaceae bacterium]|nr:hypothetical protein [Sphingobacteriaceae bacterium]